MVQIRRETEKAIILLVIFFCFCSFRTYLRVVGSASHSTVLGDWHRLWVCSLLSWQLFVS